MRRRRDKQIAFRVTVSEYTVIKNKIAESGLKQQDFLTQTILHQKVTNTDALKAFAIELRHIGNNVNQMAKVANSGGSVSFYEIKGVQEELENIWQQLRRLSAIHT